MSWACRALFSAVVAFSAPAFAALVVTEAPPRSSADLLAILESHKPDPERVNRLREIVNKPTPALTDPLDMAKFLAERGRAAGELGMLERQSADLQKAYDLMPASEPERWFLYI